MDNYMYVISLAGKHVFHEWSIQCCITSLDKLNKVRDYIKDRHGIEFSKESTNFTIAYRKYDNITDERDIKMIVEQVDIVE